MRRRTWDNFWIATVAVATALVATLGAAEPAAAQSNYAFTKIRYPGSTYTDATGVNNLGHVVGTYVDAAGLYHGYMFDGTNYTTIDFPGANHTYIFGIGSQDQVVGSYAPADYLGPWHGFIATGGVFTGFDFPGAFTDARGLNNLGQIVGGWAPGVVAPTHGYVNVGATFATIDFPGAAQSVVSGINDAGLMVGSWADSTNMAQGFLYNGNTYSALNFPLATGTFLGGLNNRGDIVGWNRQGSAYHGFVFSQNAFRTVDVPFPGTIATMALAINDTGLVVGSYISGDCATTCGFMAVPQTGASICNQTFSMSYSGTTLTLNFTLATAVPATWNVWLVASSGSAKLLTYQLPTLRTPAPLTIPLNNVPPSGPITGLSTIGTAAGVLCADIATVNTSR